MTQRIRMTSLLVLIFVALSSTISLAAEQVELTFLWPQYTPEKVRYGEYLAETFMKEHPGIKVNMVLTSNPYEKLTVMSAAGTPPDVGWLGAGWIGLQALLMPLDDFVKRDGATLEVEDYPESLWNTFNINEHQLALPSGSTVTVLYHNKDLFAQRGVNLPTPEWTWDQLIDMGKKLTYDKNGDSQPDHYGILLPHGGTWWPMIYYGGQILSDDWKTADFKRPTTRWAIETYGALFNEYGIHPPSSVYGPIGLQPFFLNERVGMYAGGSWALEPVRMASFDWDIASFPTATIEGRERRGTGMWTEEFYVGRGSKHPEEAWEFIKWATGTAALGWAAREGHVVPGRRSIGFSNDFIDPNKKPENMMAFFRSVEVATPYILHPESGNIGRAANAAINRYMSGQLSIEGALEEGHRQIQAVLDDYLANQKTQ